MALVSSAFVERLRCISEEMTQDTKIDSEDEIKMLKGCAAILTVRSGILNKYAERIEALEKGLKHHPHGYGSDLSNPETTGQGENKTSIAVLSTTWKTNWNFSLNVELGPEPDFQKYIKGWIAQLVGTNGIDDLPEWKQLDASWVTLSAVETNQKDLNKYTIPTPKMAIILAMVSINSKSKKNAGKKVNVGSARCTKCKTYHRIDYYRTTVDEFIEKHSYPQDTRKFVDVVTEFHGELDDAFRARVQTQCKPDK